MTTNAPMDDAIRARLIAQPEVILDDTDVMRALVAANERLMGANVVDLRGIAMERLESRLDRLEDTHRAVIAAAYENLAGTNQVHRAVLRLLDATDFPDFLQCLTEIGQTLQVDCARLVLETTQEEDDAVVARFGEVLTTAAPGFVGSYITKGRDISERAVTLRQVRPEDGKIYGAAAEWVRSEACLRLDLGPGRLPGLLAFGAEDPHKFSPSHGTDLLAFFAGVFERTMRRWLG